jgi:hypothetical protein
MRARSDRRRSIVTKAAIVLIAFGVQGSPAGASGRGLSTIWTIDPAPAPADAFEAAPGDYIIKQRLLPLGLVELGAVTAETASATGLSEGQQLVEVKSDAPVFCDPAIRSKKLIGHAQPCLVDADSDGRFEGLFLTSSVTKGILTFQGDRPKQARPIPAVPYRRLDPGAFKQNLFLGLQYRGNANVFGNHIFEIRFGSEEESGSLTRRLLHKKSEIPGAHDFMGGRFTILEATPRGIRVRIDRPMPSQPFAVVQTTTYRIY